MPYSSAGLPGAVLRRLATSRDTFPERRLSASSERNTPVSVLPDRNAHLAQVPGIIPFLPKRGGNARKIEDHHRRHLSSNGKPGRAEIGASGTGFFTVLYIRVINRRFGFLVVGPFEIPAP